MYCYYFAQYWYSVAYGAAAGAQAWLTSGSPTQHHTTLLAGLQICVPPRLAQNKSFIMFELHPTSPYAHTTTAQQHKTSRRPRHIRMPRLSRPPPQAQKDPRFHIRAGHSRRRQPRRHAPPGSRLLQAPWLGHPPSAAGADKPGQGPRGPLRHAGRKVRLPEVEVCLMHRCLLFSHQDARHAGTAAAGGLLRRRST